MSLPSIALYQPDIPGNTGTILRLGACLGFQTHIIGPAGFDITDRALKRAGMDYLTLAGLSDHISWEDFQTWRAATGQRLVLATTMTEQSYYDFDYCADDIILFGRESAGVPDNVHQSADARITIPMRKPARSINLAISVAMIAGEIARRFPLPETPVSTPVT